MRSLWIAMVHMGTIMGGRFFFAVAVWIFLWWIRGMEEGQINGLKLVELMEWSL